MHQKTKFLPQTTDFIRSLAIESIPTERTVLLKELIDYGRHKLMDHSVIRLHFICTHNSRRSQLAQIWAHTAAAFYEVPVHCGSGGVESTAFDRRAVQALERSGFRIFRTNHENPVYHLFFSSDAEPIQAFSKIYDEALNPNKHFAAAMTCSQADENCPIIPGAEKRIALNYKDPKELDGTPQETQEYDACNRQIATEMFYVFGKINNK